MVVGNSEQSHEVASEERPSSEDNITEHLVTGISTDETVVRGKSGSDDLAFSTMRESGYLGLEVEDGPKVTPGRFTNEERVRHRSSSVGGRWRGGRAFRKGVLGTLADLDLEANEELRHGEVLGVGHSDAT